MPNKDLYNILKVGDDVYNINAVHSDAAAKVDNQLEIKKSITGGEESITFDGTDYKSVSIVPSEGGTFTGPVEVKTLAELGLSEDEADPYIINLGEIKQRLYELTGCPGFIWDGEKLDAELNSDNQIQKISIVIGSAENYVSFLEQNPPPTFFLYFCNNSGKMYLGLAENEYVELGTTTLRIVDAENSAIGFDAKDIAEQIERITRNYEIIDEIIDDDCGYLATANAYTDEQTGKNKAEIDIINSPENGIYARAVAYTNGQISELKNTELKNVSDVAAANTNRLTNVERVAAQNSVAIQGINDISTGILANANTYTDNAVALDRARLGTLEDAISVHSDSINSINTSISTITNGTNGILVKAKEYTDTKVGALKTDLTKTTSPLKVTAADKASKDASGNTITTYYQKKITVSSAEPKSTDGVDGDIWIKY